MDADQAFSRMGLILVILRWGGSGPSGTGANSRGNSWLLKQVVQLSSTASAPKWGFCIPYTSILMGPSRPPTHDRSKTTVAIPTAIVATTLLDLAATSMAAAVPKT